MNFATALLLMISTAEMISSTKRHIKIVSSLQLDLNEILSSVGNVPSELFLKCITLDLIPNISFSMISMLSESDESRSVKSFPNKP